ncbi:hypothetical protein GJAV_G00188180 [Gymnothorax javanicus]|nr:hypothetical protein GJAV_G00188180 [Gymnothorax javanicus]
MTMEFLCGRRCAIKFLCLFILSNFVRSQTCSDPPECKWGTIPKDCKCVRCQPDRYILERSGHQRCDFCTQPCRADRHLVSIKNCTTYSNRECHCDRGYFCESAAQYTCRRCLPCPDGTFMDTTSRLPSCKQHTDCESLGMEMISRGNRTHDNVCDYIYTSLASRIQAATTSRGQAATTSRSQAATGEIQNGTTERSSAVTELTVPPSTMSADSSAHGSESGTSNKGLQTGTLKNSERALQDFQLWPIVMLFLVILVLLLGFVKCYKKLTSQSKSLQLRKNDPTTLETMKNLLSGGNPSRAAIHPVVSQKGEGPGADVGELASGGLQQVTVDHSRGRENVSNTVGSIFIYSPGTVILGTSASEQKGEDSEEEVKDLEDGQVVTDAPQEESREEIGCPFIRNKGLHGDHLSGCVEEADKNELCYPIPATGK